MAKAWYDNMHKGSFFRTIVEDWMPLIPQKGTRISKLMRFIYLLSFSSGVHALLVYRVANFCHRYYLWPLAILCRKIIYHYYHMDIWGTTVIGPGHWWPHPLGIVYSRHAVIGRRVKVYHNVSIVSSGSGAPVIGDFAYLFSGCCIMGGVRVGRGATIAAHAVVLKDVPDYAVVVGNPATIVRYRTIEEIDSEDDQGNLNPNVRATN